MLRCSVRRKPSLEPRADGTTWIEWLRTPAREASPVEIVRQLEKVTYLRELVPQIEHINPFGHYSFDTCRGPTEGRVRPLRATAYISRETPATNATATNA